MYLDYGKCEKCGDKLDAIDISVIPYSRKLCRKCRAQQPAIGNLLDVKPISYDVRIIGSKCEKCGAELIDAGWNVVGPRLCQSCQTSQALSPSFVAITFGKCEKCGAELSSLDSVSLGYEGRRLCNSCQMLEPLTSVNLLGLSGTIGSGIKGLEKGLWDPGKIALVDPRDEQITKLENRLEELEQASQSDKREINELRRHLAEVDRKMPVSRDQKVVDPAFADVCQILEQWVPACVRTYEAEYKAELAEYLRHRFIEVKEGTTSDEWDILVAKKHLIELKVAPSKSEYDRLFGQIDNYLRQFDRIACVILRISTAQRYNNFISKFRNNDRVKFFHKA